MTGDVLVSSEKAKRVFDVKGRDPWFPPDSLAHSLTHPVPLSAIWLELTGGVVKMVSRRSMNHCYLGDLMEYRG